ncbi:MAG TPA: hypothetical protein PK177_17110 [Burkholderiaceae bacterium]|nr:hypothetical protein [Burkholderiaceae bacterium]
MNPPATAATSPFLSPPEAGSQPDCRPAAVAQRLDGVCRHYRLLVVAITVLCLVTGAAPDLLMTGGRSGAPPAHALYTLAALAAIVAVTIATPGVGPRRGRRRPSIASLPRSSHGPDREWV